MAIRNGRLPAKFENVMLAAPDVDVFRSQIADMGKDRPQFTLFVSQDDRALAISRRVWRNVSRLGAIDPEPSPYEEELAQGNIVVLDLTKVESGDRLNHGKFAETPQIVQLIGRRLSDGQALTDSRIVSATAGVAATAGTAAGLALSAPVAMVDQKTRGNFGDKVGALGASASIGSGRREKPRAQCGDKDAANGCER